MPAEREAIVRIAKGLSEAQREALDYIRPHSIIAQYKFDWPTLAGLERQELISYPDAYFVSITPLGQAVRDHLKESTHE